MKGLRTQENEKFQRFFALIQAEADKCGAMFYADAGDGHNLTTSKLECEDMMGWLIPHAKVAQFEPLWNASQIDDEWSDYFVWAVWYLDGETIRIRFEEA